MTGEALIAHCLTFEGSVLKYPFGDYPACMKVNGKVYAEIYTERKFVTLKCEAELTQLLRQKYSVDVVRGYHCPQVMWSTWNSVAFNGEVNDEEILSLTRLSYDLVTKARGKKAIEKSGQKA